MIVIDSASTAPGRGHCLEPHDCVVSKLAAGREKDFAFAAALLRERLISADVLLDRIAMLDDDQARPLLRERMRAWVLASTSKL